MKLYLLALILVISTMTVGCASIMNPTVTVVSAPTAPAIVSEDIQNQSVFETTTQTIEPTVKVDIPTLSYSEKDLVCMADNLWYESRGEGDVGMAAVGYVTLNRSKTKGFPSTICGVVHHKTQVKGRTFCQFAWVCNKPAIRNWDRYSHARNIAKRVLEGTIPNPVGGSLYFHERSHRPKFAKASNYVTTVGNHRFYTAP